MTRCGHVCCEITANRYHVHQHPPELCQRCSAIPDNRGVFDGESEGEVKEAEGVDLAELVADVLAHVVPEIPGLPVGVELAELVCDETRAVHEAATVDQLLAGLGRGELLTALAGRVAMAMAFGPATTEVAR
jgi:hypothetical protein